MDCAKELEVNVKIPQRPFKRCFKYPTNTVTKWINKIINYGRYRDTEKTTTSNSSGGSRKLRYASIKGCCGLQKNGFIR